MNRILTDWAQKYAYVGQEGQPPSLSTTFLKVLDEQVQDSKSRIDFFYVINKMISFLFRLP